MKTPHMDTLPLEIVFEIRSFLPWRDRFKMISREWIQFGLRRLRHISRWRSHRLVFSYLCVFGPNFAGISWRRFCHIIGLLRRSRNRLYNLSWRAAAQHYMYLNRCQACGLKTKALVMGVHLCGRCRRKSKLKYTYMINVKEALQMGVPRHVLDRLPYHRQQYSHMRFFHQIKDAMESI